MPEKHKKKSRKSKEEKKPRYAAPQSEGFSNLHSRVLPPRSSTPSGVGRHAVTAKSQTPLHSRVVGHSPSPVMASNMTTISTRSPSPSAFYADQGMASFASSVLHSQQSRVLDRSQLTREHQIIGEKVVETLVRVPKKVFREEVREKVVVVPETVQVEEVVQDTVKVREKIIEVAKPIIHEKIVEVPEIEVVEKIVEVPEIVIEEKIREVPRIDIVEKVSRVPKIVVKEKIVEVPEYEYREVEVEKIVEVPEVREEIVYKEVLVDQVVEVPVPEYHTIEVPQDIDRYLPVPVEAITYYEFRLPKMTAKYNKTPYRIYAPRFIEVPIPTSAIDDGQMSEVDFVLENVKALCSNPCPNLCEVEKLAEYAKTRNYNFQIDETMLQQKFALGQL